MIGPEKRTAPELSEEYGISVATIHGWKAKLKNGTLSVMGIESSSNERKISLARPELGRFTAVDPIRDGQNWYVYTGNDPVNYVDLCGGLAAEDGAASDGSEELYGASGGTLGGGTPANSEPGLWDKVKSKVDALVTGLTKLNFENRDANNTNLPSKDEIANQPGWRCEYKDAFHQNGGTRDEKWVNDLDGREVVYGGDTDQVLTDQYRGTYNYMNVAPNPQKWYDVGGWLKVGGTMLGHGVMDVAPWYILGIDRKE